MRKWIFMILAVGLLFLLAGCGTDTTKPAAESTKDVAQTVSGPANSAVSKNKKILIAYFSWSGHTKKVAEKIQMKTGGKLFAIQPVKAYPTDYNACADYAKREQADNGRPAIANSVENMADYDVIFIGYPIWWYDAPMIIDTFLESYDFTGKTIIPFCTSEGTDITDSVASIRKLAPRAKVMDGLTANEPEKIDPWIDQLKL